MRIYFLVFTLIFLLGFLQSYSVIILRPQVLLCLSTNMLEHLDPAIISRSTCLAIDLPALPERNAWWRAHAKHLAAPEQLQLAETTEGLSFRDLSQVAERVERAAARKEESLKHCTAAWWTCFCFGF